MVLEEIRLSLDMTCQVNIRTERREQPKRMVGYRGQQPHEWKVRVIAKPVSSANLHVFQFHISGDVVKVFYVRFSDVSPEWCLLVPSFHRGPFVVTKWRGEPFSQVDAIWNAENETPSRLEHVFSYLPEKLFRGMVQVLHAVERGDDVEALGYISDAINDHITRDSGDTVFLVNLAAAGFPMPNVREVVDHGGSHSQLGASGSEHIEAAANIADGKTFRIGTVQCKADFVGNSGDFGNISDNQVLGIGLGDLCECLFNRHVSPFMVAKEGQPRC